MAINEMHTSTYWRMRAEEFRTKADNFEDGPAKDVLLIAAKQCDELARRAEKIRIVQAAD